MNEKTNEDKIIFKISYEDIRELADEYFDRKLTVDELDAVFDELIDSWGFAEARWDMEYAIREGISKALRIKEVDDD